MISGIGGGLAARQAPEYRFMICSFKSDPGRAVLPPAPSPFVRDSLFGHGA